MTNQYSLLIDIGGTDIKVGVIEVGESELLSIKRYPTPTFLDLSGLKREIPPTILMQTCLAAISQAEKSFGRFRTVALSGQMGCWLITDAENNPVSNIVSWQDKRADERMSNGCSFREFAQAKYGNKSLILAGNEMRSGLPLFGLFTFLHKAKRKEKFRFHSLISWVASQLVKDHTYIVHETDFAASGMFNLETKTKMDSLNDFFINDLDFPEVTGEFVKVGKSFWGSSDIMVGVGDQQASLYGSKLAAETVVINIGTGGQIASPLSNYPGSPDLQVRPYFENKLIQTRTHLPAGRAINSYLSALTINDIQLIDYENLFNLEIQEPSVLVPRDVSNFESDVLKIQSPKDMREAQKISREIVYGFFVVYRDALKKFEMLPSQNLTFAGGVGQNFKALQNLLTQEFKLDLQIADTQESTLQGLARLISGDK
jgi:xylulokinase